MSRNRVAVITGAAHGIGRALAQQCAALNMDLVLADIDAAALDAIVTQLYDTAHGCRRIVVPVVTDVADEVSVARLAQQSFEHFKQIDWVINNAGISGALGPVWELEIAAVRQVLDTNFYGVLHGVRAFMPYLLRQSVQGHIVNMASMLGLFSCSHFAPYVISKHAIVALSEALYYDLQRHNAASIKISVVCPGFVNTNIMGESTVELTQNITHFVAQSSDPVSIAAAIIHGIEQGQFYILTHPAVKKYVQQRTNDIQNNAHPSVNKIERLLLALDNCENYK